MSVFFSRWESILWASKHFCWLRFFTRFPHQQSSPLTVCCGLSFDSHTICERTPVLSLCIFIMSQFKYKFLLCVASQWNGCCCCCRYGCRVYLEWYVLYNFKSNANGIIAVCLWILFIISSWFRFLQINYVTWHRKLNWCFAHFFSFWCFFSNGVFVVFIRLLNKSLMLLKFAYFGNIFEKICNSKNRTVVTNT